MSVIGSSETVDRPIPTRVKQGIFIFFVGYLFVLYVLGFTSFIDVSPNGITILGTSIIASLIAIIASFEAFNSFAESQLKNPKRTLMGIGIHIGLMALSYFGFCAALAFGIDFSLIGYWVALLNIILTFWGIYILNFVVGYILVYLIW